MGFYATITDSAPFASQIFEALEYAEYGAHCRGEHAKKCEFRNLGNQVRDIYANAGRRINGKEAKERA
jgi:hypothetical protein